MRNEMACIQLVELVTDYLEGALAEPDRQRFEAHLDECVHCGEYVEQIRAVGGALAGVTEPGPDREQLKSLLAAFRDRRA